MPDEPPQTPAPIPKPPADWTLDTMVEKFVQLRDKVAEIKKRQTDEMAPYNATMGTLEAWMLDALNATGTESARTKHGTVFKSTRTSTKVMDWTATLNFIREVGAWDLLEARVSKTAAEAIMTETQQPIPGLSVSRETTLNVRRA